MYRLDLDTARGSRCDRRPRGGHRVWTHRAGSRDIVRVEARTETSSSESPRNDPDPCSGRARVSAAIPDRKRVALWLRERARRGEGRLPIVAEKRIGVENLSCESCAARHSHTRAIIGAMRKPTRLSIGKPRNRKWLTAARDTFRHIILRKKQEMLSDANNRLVPQWHRNPPTNSELGERSRSRVFCLQRRLCPTQRSG